MSRNTSKFYQLESSFWTRRKTREIAYEDTDALYLYIYLLSSPATNRIGILEFSPEQTAKHTGLDSEMCADSLKKLVDKGVCYFDDDMGFIWLPEILDTVFRKGHNDKHLIGLYREINRLIYEDVPFAEDALNFCSRASERFQEIVEG